MTHEHLAHERYGWERFGGDVSGGIIAALIALPYGLAMASLMGLPPVLGIYTSILTAPLIALLGRNPVLIGGTASATVPFVAFAVRQRGIEGAAQISIMAAVFLLAFGWLRLGRHIARVPHAVVTGFSCGIGGMMVVSQLDTLLGLGAPAQRVSPTAAAQFLSVAERLGQARTAPLVLGLAVIVGAMLVSRLTHHAPAPLIGVAAAFVIARVYGFHEREVGALPAILAPAIHVTARFADLLALVPQAFALAFVAGVNILITSRVVEHFRGRHKRHEPDDADRELRAYGAANLIAGAFGAPPSVGIPARSLAVVRCGGSTPLANLVHAAVLVTILWWGASFVAHIPIPALAGVTAWMGICLLDWSAWRRLPKMSRVDAAAFLVTAGAVMTVNAVAAVGLGCSLYLLRWAWLKHMRAAEAAA